MQANEMTGHELERSAEKPIAVGINNFPDSLGGKLKDVMVLFDNLNGEDGRAADDYHRRKHTRFPLKSESVMFLEVVRGTCTLTINMEDVEVRAGQVLGIMPGSVFVDKKHSDDMQFCCFSMSNELYDAILKTVGVYVSLPDRYARFFVVDVSEEIMRSNIEMYKVMRSELMEPDYPTKKMVMERYCEIMLLKCIYRVETRKPAEKPVPPSRRIQIYRDFLELLEANFRRERSISYYASQLCLTPKYLSTVVKDVSGKHGSQWIDEYVTLEAKALIRQGTYNIKQISDQLNFASQSMFGRFFKKMTGYSPKEYKQL